jgi:PAS domain-containing protein
VEERLRWNETLLSRIAQASPLAYLVVDHRTDEILYFNRMFCEMWGFSHLEDEMGQGTFESTRLPPSVPRSSEPGSSCRILHAAPG